jgi:hypothetical protein
LRAEKVPHETIFAATSGKTFSQVRRQNFSGRAVKTLQNAVESGVKGSPAKMHKGSPIIQYILL